MQHKKKCPYAWFLHSCVIYLLTIGMPVFAAEPGDQGEIALISDPENPSLVFAMADLKKALRERGHVVTVVPLSDRSEGTATQCIVLATLGDEGAMTQFKNAGGIVPTGLRAQGFGVRNTTQGQKRTIWIWGADSVGAMYGGLELAEVVALEGLSAVKPADYNAHLTKRGLKMNIPLDARTPSYADAGSAAQSNIPEMWSWDFWCQHLDAMARHRYNVVTLWNPHPFPSLVKVPEYPRVALNDVKRSTMDWRQWYPNYHNSGATMYNPEAMASLETVKVMSIEEKIVFWRRVMAYARVRGIEFYLITWNVFVSSAGEHYGITRDMDNPITIDYVRKSVRTAFQTYPDLAGIGVTAGEGMPGASMDEKEKWLWNTYGQGLMDAKQEDPNRTYRFIHRYWWSSIPDIMSYFQGFDDDVIMDFSFKYARARLYANTDPTFADKALEGLPSDMKFWWNLRNDDIFNFRWGDPDYVRSFIKHFPPSHQTLGFHMGSDGYIWGRECTSTEPEPARQLEMHKHWYKYMLWGRLGYDPQLSNARFQKILQHRFPGTDASRLFALWQRASKIIPAVNRWHWHDWDYQWAVEYCRSQKGFHKITDACWKPGGTATAQELQGHARYVLEHLKDLDSSQDRDLRLTLGDLQAMAHLGNYYAEKILAADKKETDRAQAVAHLVAAAAHWEKYAKVASAQYTPQLLGRNGWMDWNATSEDVLKDIALLRD